MPASIARTNRPPAAKKSNAELLASLDAAKGASHRDRATGAHVVNGTPLREFGESQLKALVEQELKKPGAP